MARMFFLIRWLGALLGFSFSAGAFASTSSECGSDALFPDFLGQLSAIVFSPSDSELVSEAETAEPESPKQVLSPEEQAALATIRYAEGADYNRMFGYFENKSRVFDPHSQIGHPNSPYTSSSGYTSTAAGAYQAMPDTWAEEVGKGTIANNFTPDNQDLFALARLEYRGLLEKVQSGDTSWIDSRQMGQEWASFPNSPYGQPIKSSENLRSYYFKKLTEYRAQN